MALKDIKRSGCHSDMIPPSEGKDQIQEELLLFQHGGVATRYQQDRMLKFAV